MPLFLRAILLTVPRFIVILALVIGLNHLDVSPLPEWTIAITAYALHFLITFLFGYWAMRNIMPSLGQVFMVAGIFLLFGVLWEVGLYTWMTQSTFTDVLSGFSRESLWLLCIYAVATLLSGAYARQARVSLVSSDIGA